jgi:hypothetical protein
MFIWIAGALFAVGFAVPQAGAGTGVPGCDTDGVATQIEVNALRAGAKTVVAGPNQTANVTAKARILKGTAPTGTTMETTLVIEASDDGGVIGDPASSGPITLGVGKGGKGDKLTVDTTRCIGGFITFTATFTGTDDDGDICEGTRDLRKECR